MGSPTAGDGKVETMKRLSPCGEGCSRWIDWVILDKGCFCLDELMVDEGEEEAVRGNEEWGGNVGEPPPVQSTGKHWEILGKPVPPFLPPPLPSTPCIRGRRYHIRQVFRVRRAEIVHMHSNLQCKVML
jgi:hypothetical protein